MHQRRPITGEPPARVDRLIVHQFDPAKASPGGIDSCLRGVCRYLPDEAEVAVVGVDTGVRPDRRLGRWELYGAGQGSGDYGLRPFWFLPVTRLDPADQARRVPHAVRVVAGVARYRSRLPQADLVQVHRMDSAVALRLLLRRPQAYFIHTQENGLTGTTSDSFWRFAGHAHRVLERSVVRHAEQVVVFNEDYSDLVRRWNPAARFSPTWYDPALIDADHPDRDPYKIVWVGRLEVPKDPELAIEAFTSLVRSDPASPWSLDVLGSGTLADRVAALVAALPDCVGDRIRLLGRVPPTEVGVALSRAGLFLMTSHPGYEGYPRVLVESMASGLPAVVTEGSDTGGLVVDGLTGFVTDRDPAVIARRLRQARALDREPVRRTAAPLDAPTLVRRLFAPGPTSTIGATQRVEVLR